MIERPRHIFIKIAYVVIDVVMVLIAVYSAFFIRPHTVQFDINFYNLFLNQSNPFHLLMLIWLVSIPILNNANGLYQTRREVKESVELWQVAKSVFVASLIIMTTTYLFKILDYPRSVFIYTTVLLTILLSVWRIFKRMFVEYLAANGYNNFNVLIIGAGKVGVNLAREIDQHPGFGLKIVGFLDDYKNTDDIENGYKVLGKLDDFRKIARQDFIHKIFITIHHDSNVFYHLLEEAKELGIAVRVVPPAFDLTTGDLFRYNIGFIPVLEYSDGAIPKQTGKRFFDFAVGLFLLMCMLPVFLMIAIIIKIDSRGPVFFVSERFGRGGRLFPMIKFRSMVQGADKSLNDMREQNEVDGPIFKMRNDPRVTKFGVFLRKFSLDELPQIINVVKGEMSLVGPRPLPMDQIEKEDLKQLKRLEIRPGITGLWQVRGRSDLPFKRLVKWDVWYINNWSFGLDLSILLQTIPVVFSGKGAY